ncbi:hypothetical protein [Mumia sp. DW29H23]|uniref:hypothetical protein n=1 Tax=Mumia sp. DW29H23 TaxID=3421241 RepID=UPI003D696006
MHASTGRERPLLRDELIAVRTAVWFGGWIAAVVLGYVVLPYATMLVIVELVEAWCGGLCDPYTEESVWSLPDSAILLWAVWWVVFQQLAIITTLILTALMWILLPPKRDGTLPPRWRVSIFLLAATVLFGPTCLGLGILFWFP